MTIVLSEHEDCQNVFVITNSLVFLLLLQDDGFLLVACRLSTALKYHCSMVYHLLCNVPQEVFCFY